jgi:hypothetical protein
MKGAPNVRELHTPNQKLFIQLGVAMISQAPFDLQYQNLFGVKPIQDAKRNIKRILLDLRKEMQVQLMLFVRDRTKSLAGSAAGQGESNRCQPRRGCEPLPATVPLCGNHCSSKCIQSTVTVNEKGDGVTIWKTIILSLINTKNLKKLENTILSILSYSSGQSQGSLAPANSKVTSSNRFSARKVNNRLVPTSGAIQRRSLIGAKLRIITDSQKLKLMLWWIGSINLASSTLPTELSTVAQCQGFCHSSCACLTRKGSQCLHFERYRLLAIPIITKPTPSGVGLPKIAATLGKASSTHLDCPVLRSTSGDSRRPAPTGFQHEGVLLSLTLTTTQKTIPIIQMPMSMIHRGVVTTGSTVCKLQNLCTGLELNRVMCANVIGEKKKSFVSSEIHALAFQQRNARRSVQLCKVIVMMLLVMLLYSTTVLTQNWLRPRGVTPLPRVLWSRLASSGCQARAISPTIGTRLLVPSSVNSQLSLHGRAAKKKASGVNKPSMKLCGPLLLPFNASMTVITRLANNSTERRVPLSTVLSTIPVCLTVISKVSRWMNPGCQPRRQTRNLVAVPRVSSQRADVGGARGAYLTVGALRAVGKMTERGRAARSWVRPRVGEARVGNPGPWYPRVGQV